MEGKILGGKYQLIEKLREQRFYDVYEARVLNLDQRVLLKLVKPNLVDDRTFGAMKPNLAVVASLRHSGLSSLREYGESGGTVYLAEEYFDGAALNEVIEKAGTINAVQALGQGIKIVDAVGAAHGRGVVHGLLTPESILLGRDLSVKVSDFYCLYALTAELKTAAEFQGRDIIYCAPEVIAGAKPTFASDVYSIGVILYELLTGKPPFTKESALAAALERESEAVKSPREINPDIPRLLETVILKCLKKEPGARYEDARRLLTELHLCRSSLARVLADAGARHSFGAGSVRSEEEEVAGDGPRPRGRDAGEGVAGYGGGGPAPGEYEEPEEYMEEKRKLPQGFIPFLISLFLLILLLVVGYQYVSKTLGGPPTGATVVVPSVEEKSVVEAKAILGQKGLVPKVVGRENSKEVPEGCVIKQEPPEGARVKAGREVELVVSAGEQKVSVPAVTGQTLEDARVILETAGFAVGEVREEYDESTQDGFVTGQVPEAGERRYLGHKINLTVSKGDSPYTVAMPRLVNLKESDARSILDMNNMKNVRVVRLETGAAVSGFVAAQSVLENVRINPENEVVLYVAEPPGPAGLIETKGVVNMKISTESDYQEVLVFVFDQDGGREVYRQLHANGEMAKIEISGYGRTHVMVYLDGVLAKEQTL